MLRNALTVPAEAKTASNAGTEMPWLSAAASGHSVNVTGVEAAHDGELAFPARSSSDVKPPKTTPRRPACSVGVVCMCASAEKKDDEFQLPGTGFVLASIKLGPATSPSWGRASQFSRRDSRVSPAFVSTRCDATFCGWHVAQIR